MQKLEVLKRLDFQPEQNEEQLNLSLDLLEEMREQAQLKATVYKQRPTRYFNSKLNPRSFRI